MESGSDSQLTHAGAVPAGLENALSAPQSGDLEANRSKHDVGWRRIVRNFTPAWFSVNMGTGIVSLLLNTLPYNGLWLYYISIIIFVLNVLYFATFCVIATLRYTLYPEIFKAMITHPAQSMFLGTFPMGLATIISVFCNVCVPAWGDGAAYFAWALWILDAVLAVMTATVVPFIVMTRKTEISLSAMNAAWLLPIVSCVVAAASGAVVAGVLPNAQHALWTVMVSYALWGMGVPLAMMVMAIYLQRLLLHKLPPKTVLVSVFLPLGPLGQGGFGIQKLGECIYKIFPETQSLHGSTGIIFYEGGFIIGLIMWAFGLIWMFFAAASLIRARKFPFNLSWWGLTFPLGVYAMCTCQLGRELPSTFFAVLGTIFSVIVVLLWLLVSFHTIRGTIRGDLFEAPCVADLDRRKREDSE
ncbi:sulfite efflux pump SSU1 [Aspergillus steynii IBT 23096]|uniref:Sulfite efflux pump SSU1 n=1 Tax=Aspergillus steynii IBT 23096 TaxID=1392250 RepID=A0A2I2GAA6_9EURO|nr:sulfite efflux pump SSU1 [Aspergillus steynii IBT 23096]PLB49810.1 sulfite efflux pump SSU1 [Aspergillus steynii IBT 23096]